MTEEPESALRRELQARHDRRCTLRDLVRVLLIAAVIAAVFALAVLLRCLW